MVLGYYTYGIENIRVHFGSLQKDVVIGNFCSIATNCQIFIAANHRTDWVTTYPFGGVHQHAFPFHGNGIVKPKRGVTIGNDVWIGANCTIMDGVQIADGAVIANNSHVVKNVNPYEIVGGNPAKHIKYRFTPEQMRRLMEIKWWTLDNQRIQEVIPALCSRNIQDFINLFNDT
jgi:acetyltransferase-like isoleucine patch superfamily enzyme